MVDTHKDPGYLRFRQGSVKLGCLTTLAAVTSVGAYIASTWGQPHRGVMAVLIGMALLSVVAMFATRAERIVATRWCDVFFGIWSSGDLAIIIALAILDGGVGSPLVMVFFPVLVFAGLCYPLRMAVYVGIGGMASILAVGLATRSGGADVAWFVAGCLGMTAIMCCWQAYTLERGRRELAQASRTDHLTGSLNRRGFHEHTEAELARASRSGEPVALVLIDLDGFKAVNDVHGHAAGDELLCWVVEQFRSALRPSDAAGRLGGDEFALLLPGIDADAARLVVERLRDALAERTPASFGVAAYPTHTEAEALHAQADNELYAEKRGRRPQPALSRLALETAERYWY
jgi:diguanylate cyclase (GGDEF)-like protein